MQNDDDSPKQRTKIVRLVVMHKKIHIVFSGNTAWGMYTFRGKMLNHFARKVKVTVIAPHDDVYSKKLKELGCHVVDIDIQAKGKNPLVDFLLTLKYLKLFRRLKPDLSITYTIKPNIYASIAARVLGIPFFPVTTGLGYVFLHKNLTSMVAKGLYKLAFHKAKQVWFLNTDDMEMFKKSGLVAEDRIRLLHGEGIDTKSFSLTSLSEGSGAFKFLLFGRMLADKGLYEYVDAARIVKKKCPSVEFLLLGPLWKENPTAISEKQLSRWSSEGLVNYLGATDDVREFVRQADCVVLPSYREGIPFSLMEGASMGRPLIATDIPGCRDVVIDGKTGYLCEVKDAKSLANAMGKMLALTPNQRKEMGLAGREYMVREFDIKQIIRQYDSFIEKVLKIKL